MGGKDGQPKHPVAEVFFKRSEKRFKHARYSLVYFLMQND